MMTAGTHISGNFHIEREREYWEILGELKNRLKNRMFMDFPMVPWMGMLVFAHRNAPKLLEFGKLSQAETVHQHHNIWETPEKRRA